MADDTPVLGLPFPEGDDAPNGPAAIQALAEAVEGAIIPPGLVSGQGLLWNGTEWVASGIASDADVAAAVATHAADTTAVHGIADTAALETTAGSTAKVAAHESDTSVHGIADTTALATDAELATHAADTSSHGVTSAIVGTDETQTLINKTLGAGTVLPIVPAAKAKRTSNQSIPNNAMTTVTFPSEDFDTDTIHDTVTNSGRLTCKTAGLYAVNGRAHFETSTLILQISCVLRVNGTTDHASRDMPVGGFDGAWPIGTAAHLALAVNDYVEFRVYQLQESGSAAKNVEAAEFSMARIGRLS